VPEIRLEPLSTAHLDGVHRLVADPAVLRFTRIPEPVPVDFPERSIGRWSAHG
jgi:hypothetical protein